MNPFKTKGLLRTVEQGLVPGRHCGSSPRHEAGCFLEGLVRYCFDYQCGGGAPACSRPTPSDSVSVDPAPASSGGPRRSLRVWDPVRCALAFCGPRLGANEVGRPVPGSGAGALEVRSREGGGGPSPCAAAAPGTRNAPAGRPGRHNLGRVVALVLCASPCLRAVPPGCGRIGCRGAPAAAPQPESLPFGHASARAPQPRLPSDFTGESNGAAQLPRVRRTHLGRAISFFGPGRRLRLASPVPSDHFGASSSES
ncbi:hypothetical protein NDU88_007851 [Pleurodeles waltl]|uniref:Uncharacterized protein n=1 Tax=Pleurodeles waltl TaxID=8319 RepID=A0AAV7PSM4_PLEWA|nr:hypothetical protein NDU88_007851 [Pleurodeles waltl]